MFNLHGLVSTVVRLSLLSFVILFAIAVPAVAQTPPQSASNVGSFRGRIIDADTGQLITEEGVTIVVTKEGESAATRRVIDVQGEFVVSDLSLGRYRVQFRYKGIEFETPRTVQVTGLTAITPVNIYLRPLGAITGVVADKEGEPVQGSQVLLVTVKYLGGQALYTVYSSAKKTDDRGYYSLSPRVEAGLPYFLLALPPEETRPTLSGTPSFEATWYPGRPGVFQPFVLRSAERKRVDLVMEKKKTHCVDGRLTENGKPAILNFEIAIHEAAGYLGFTGGTQGVISKGQSDASGHFQACGLWPGEFLIAAGLNSESYGRSTVSIVDSDVHDVRLNTHSPVTLHAEIHWDSAQTPAQTYRLSFQPLSRVAFESQPGFFRRVDVVVSSQFAVSLLPSTDYVVWLDMPGGTSEAYLKDVTCGGTIRRNSLTLGDADCGLHITVGTDMGKLAGRVVDKDNNTDLNSLVCVYLTSAVTPEEIASTGTCSAFHDPETGSVSIAVRPGRYFAVAVPAGTSDWVEYVSSNRGQISPIEITARSTAQLTLKSGTGR